MKQTFIIYLKNNKEKIVKAENIHEALNILSYNDPNILLKMIHWKIIKG